MLPIKLNIPRKLVKSTNRDIDIQPFSKRDLKELSKVLEIKKTINSDGKTRVVESIGMHSDAGGHCFLYLLSGFGVFHTEDDSIPISGGFFTLFNDTKPHGFTLLSRSAVVAVCNYRGINPYFLKPEFGYLKIRN